MKKTAIATALLIASTGAANAALVAGSTLSIDAGSNFTMEVAPGFHLPTGITGLNGVVLGTSQAASGSHTGAPDGSESADIDNPWSFFSNTGMHYTSSPTDIMSDDGAGNATVDMSGWGVAWNGIPAIPMGTGAWGANANGVGIISCGNTCEDGDSYTLTYTATVPVGDPSGFGGVAYGLNLTGTISAVPVPAAVWLFGSGLVGLAGIARRRKTA